MPNVISNGPDGQDDWVAVALGAPYLNEHATKGLAPTLPPFQQICQKQSFVKMFDSGLPVLDTQNPAMVSPATTLIMQGDCRGNRNGARASKMPDVVTSQLLDDLVPAPIDDTFIENIATTSLRYTSSGSSTARSKGTSDSPPSSRPSSRSSVDDSPKTDRQSRGTILHTTKPCIYPSGCDVVRRKSLRIRNTARPDSEFLEMSHKNKPLPPSPGQLNLRDTISCQQYDQCSIRTSLLNSSKSKRGARLGKQRVEGTMNQSRTEAKNDANVRQSRYGHESPRPNVITQTKPSTSLTVVATETAEPTSLHSCTPERVLLTILSQSSNLDDLQALSMANKGFNRAFRRYEKDLVSRVLYKFSLPAWELHQIMKCEQKRGAFRLRSIQKDMATVRALQAFILMKCESLCRPSTVDALLGGNAVRKVELDNALWRIWVFCKLFGRGEKKEETFHSQLSWLDGGERRTKSIKAIALGMCNGTGLSMLELEDLSEVWSCLEALLGGFKGREDEAKKAGIFNQCVMNDETDGTATVLLNEWVHDILALGPKAVLILTTCSFEQAKVLGITKWTPPEPGKSRARFFKAAVEHVYRERLASKARSQAMQYEKIIRLQTVHKRSISLDTSTPARTTVHPIVTGNHQSQPNVVQTTLTIPGTLGVRPDSDPPSASQSKRISMPMTPNTPIFSSFALTPGVSARMGASLFPLKSTSPQSPGLMRGGASPQLQSPTGSPGKAVQFNDPIDAALYHLVKARGFPMPAAKRALAMSDNGCGIDVAGAIEMLSKGFKGASQRKTQDVSELQGSLPAHVTASTPSFKPLDHQMSGKARPAPLKLPPRERRRLSKSKRYRGESLGVIMDDEEEDDGIKQNEIIDSQTSPSYQVATPTVLLHSHSTGPFTNKQALSLSAGRSFRIQNNHPRREQPRRALSESFNTASTQPNTFSLQIKDRAYAGLQSPNIGLGMHLPRTNQAEKSNTSGRVWTWEPTLDTNTDNRAVNDEHIGCAY